MDIRTATSKELIKEFDLKTKVIDRHYEITTEFCDVSDITDGTMVEYIADYLYDEFGGRFEDYDFWRKAKEIMDEIEDEVVKKIFEKDENAKEDYDAREEGRKGNY